MEKCEGKLNASRRTGTLGLNHSHARTHIYKAIWTQFTVEDKKINVFSVSSVDASITHLIYTLLLQQQERIKYKQRLRVSRQYIQYHVYSNWSVLAFEWIESLSSESVADEKEHKLDALYCYALLRLCVCVFCYFVRVLQTWMMRANES